MAKWRRKREESETVAGVEVLASAEAMDIEDYVAEEAEKVEAPATPKQPEKCDSCGKYYAPGLAACPFCK